MHFAYNSENIIKDAFSLALSLKEEYPNEYDFFRYVDRFFYDKVPLSNINDLSWKACNAYIGLDELWDVNLFNDEFHQIYNITLVYTMISMSVLMFMLRLNTKYIDYKNNKNHLNVNQIDKNACSLYVVTGFTYFLQIFPYSFLIIIFLFSKRLDLAINKYFPMLAVMVTSHLIIYIIDLFLRANKHKMDYLLFCHHVFWFLVLMSSSYFKSIVSFKIAVVSPNVDLAATVNV